jgi:hypothetical protein
MRFFFMGPRIFGIMVAAALTINNAAAAEPDIYSANYTLPGCRERGSPFKAGLCYGNINGLSFFLKCIPVPVSNAQKALVVVAYIDARPERLHEDFRQLALEALQAAWPCK